MWGRVRLSTGRTCLTGSVAVLTQSMQSYLSAVGTAVLIFVNYQYPDMKRRYLQDLIVAASNALSLLHDAHHSRTVHHGGKQQPPQQW